MTVNMFKALRIEQNEVMMCRFLADLLDPHGWHGYRAKFLKSFLRDVIKLGDFEDTLLERTCVMTEYLIEKDRRIDIMLQNPEFSIPIEAKINARDQQSQCYDYQPYARNAQLVYLTKEGTPPDEASRRAADGTGEATPIVLISWKQICLWLEEESAPLEQVRQYTEAIRSFLPVPQKPQAGGDLLCLVREVLEEFRHTMAQGTAAQFGLEELPHSYKSYLDWEEKQHLKFCPGLNYRVRHAAFSQKETLQMWFRIEVADDGYLAAGFCLADVKPGKSGSKVNANSIPLEAIKHLDRCILSRDNWWFVWRFSNGRQDAARDDVPNFRTMNEYAQKLGTASEREKFVKAAVRIFTDQLLGYLKP
ncbi:MAG: PD-(D/E)XK nuclease family protein [Oscillospiraceae bacterium]|nr:PD-(D/E)XK nuclease family protein [Oscillospiraceae bacterium]